MHRAWKSRYGIFFILFFQGLRPAFAQTPITEEATLYSPGELSRFNGRIIERIEIHGRTRTSEVAIRGLLAAHAGDPFDANTWMGGLKKLYNTGALYEIRTRMEATNDGPLRIHLDLREKWTLIPYLQIQSGGGDAAYLVGITDANLGGYFSNLTLISGAYNQSPIFDVSFFQEWFLDTPYVFGLDVSRYTNPFTLQNPDGTIVQNFIWSRNQQQILIGRRVDPNLRLYGFFETFSDSIVSQNRPVQIYTGVQYRLRPTLIYGRSNTTNFLESGSEWSISPRFANFFSSDQSYEGLVSTFKKTVITPQGHNLAVFLGGGITTPTPIPYQFRLGGYDSVRGFNTNRLVGTLYFNTSLEFRPTLLAHKFGWELLDFVAIQGCLFTDAGTLRTDQGWASLWSVGAGLRFNFVKYAGSLLRFDFAQTLSPAEGYGISFGLGQFF